MKYAIVETYQGEVLGVHKKLYSTLEEAQQRVDYLNVCELDCWIDLEDYSYQEQVVLYDQMTCFHDEMHHYHAVPYA